MVPWGRKPNFDKFYDPSVISDVVALEVLQSFVIEVRLTERIRLRRGSIGGVNFWTVIVYDSGHEFLVDINNRYLDLGSYEARENVTHFTLAKAYNLAVDQVQSL